MGEHVKWQGQSIKVGTCEDLYYVTFEQMQLVADTAEKLGGNLAPREYLDPKHGWRYRFPFPEEDGKQPGSYEQYNYGRLIAAPPDAPFVQKPEDHDEIPTSISVGGCYNVNARLPCPASGKLKAVSMIPQQRPLELIQQKQMQDGTLWTVLRCGWCKQPYRLPPEEAEALAAFLKDYDQPNAAYWLKVADRILAGYRRGQAEGHP